MEKINWKQKLTSRKFWAALIGVATSLMVLFGVNDITMEQVVGLISTMSVLIAYIIGEGLVDSSRIKSAAPQMTLLESSILPMQSTTTYTGDAVSTTE